MNKHKTKFSYLTVQQASYLGLWSQFYSL